MNDVEGYLLAVVYAGFGADLFREWHTSQLVLLQKVLEPDISTQLQQLDLVLIPVIKVD